MGEMEALSLIKVPSALVNQDVAGAPCAALKPERRPGITAAVKSDGS